MVDMKKLAVQQIDEILEAAKAYQSGELDRQGIDVVFWKNREISRVIGLRNKIAENAKKTPAKDLLEYAGVSE